MRRRKPVSMIERQSGMPTSLDGVMLDPSAQCLR